MIRVKNLHKSFGDNEVLKGIDIHVAPGEIVAIIGPSGSGKSTLLRSLNLLETPDSGEITIGDVQVDAGRKITPKATMKLRQKTAMVFQHYNLFRNRSVINNVADPVVLRTIANRTDAIAKAEALLAQVGISEQVSRQFPATLSGGQSQRVSIARALAIDPDAVLLDEPTSALDPELVAEVLAVIKDLAQDNTTMLIVTHEMRFAAEVADRVIFMDDGQVVEEGPAQQVIYAPVQPRTRKFLNQQHVALERAS